MRASARELLVPFFTPLVWCGRGIRTNDLPLRRRTLYQLSYRGGIEILDQAMILLDCVPFQTGNSLASRGANSFLYEQFLVVWKITFIMLSDLP